MTGRGRQAAWLARIGCAIYAILGGVYALAGLFVYWMGPCPAFSGKTDCHWSAARAFWIFPGSQISVVAGGILLALFVRRWTRP